MKFRQRGQEIEAMQFTGGNAREVEKWSRGAALPSPVLEPTKDNPTGEYLQLLDTRSAIVGDWVVRNPTGHFYVMTHKQFEEDYEELTSGH